MGTPKRHDPSDALTALADPQRRAILELLSKAPRSVQEIADRLPISRPAVSRHLRLLKKAALVSDQPQGTQRIYHLEAEGVAEVRRYLESVWGLAGARFRLLAENRERVMRNPRRKGDRI